MNNKNKLRYLTLKLTDKCNLKCTMCGQANSGNSKYKEIPLGTIKEILEQTDSLEHVYLFGGEPLLYSEFDLLLDMIRERKLPSLITTNGMVLNRFTDKIIDGGVRDIELSIDSHKREVYKQIRIGGDLDTVEDNLRILIECKKNKKAVSPKIGLNCVILHENCYDLLDYYNYFIRKYPEINQITFEFPIKTNKEIGECTNKIYRKEFQCNCESWLWFSMSTQEFTKNEVEEINRQISVLSKYEKVKIKGFQETQEEGKCCYPFSSISVLPDGNLTFCTDFPDVIVGNLKDSTINEIWNSNKAESFREYMEKNECFPICKCCTHFAEKFQTEREKLYSLKE